jgi:hypothetical protein
MVVPRSAQELAKDDEFTLFGVVTFKKVSPEFVHKAREARWIPRDYKYVEGGKEQEAKEVDSLSKEERKIWGEALRLGRTGYSESAMVWVHVLALRVFVETVLRYGLPLDFVAGLVQVCSFRLLFIPLENAVIESTSQRDRTAQFEACPVYSTRYSHTRRPSANTLTDKLQARHQGKIESRQCLLLPGRKRFWT